MSIFRFRATFSAAAAAIALFAAGPAAAAPDAAEALPKKSVNNPAGDTNPHDFQHGPTVLDLGGGKLVAAFADNRFAVAVPDVAAGGDMAGDLLPSQMHRIGYAFSSNGGKTWTDAGHLPDTAVGDGTSPVLAHGEKARRVYLAATSFEQTKILVFRSANNGHSFGAPVDASKVTGIGLYKPWIAVDNAAGAGNGNVYVCWSDNQAVSYGVRLTRSIDGGASFGPDGGLLVAAKGFGCNIVVGPDHEVYVFYFAGDDAQGLAGDNRLLLRRSFDNGQTFGPEIEVADLKTGGFLGSVDGNGEGSLRFAYPNVAINPGKNGGQLYVVYSDDTTPADPSDDSAAIFLVASNDGGLTWSAPKPVNDEKSGIHYGPSIAFDDTGRLLVGYYSTSHDPGADQVVHRRGRLGSLTGKKGKSFKLDRSFQMSANSPVIPLNEWAGANGYATAYDQIAGRGSVFTALFSVNRKGGAFTPFAPDVFAARIASDSGPADVQVRVVKAPKTLKLGRKATFELEVGAKGGIAEDVFLAVPNLPGIKFGKIRGRNCQTALGVADCGLGSLKDGQTKTVKLEAIAAYGSGGKLAAFGTSSSRDTKARNNRARRKVKVAGGGVETATFSTGDIATPIPPDSFVDIPVVVAPGGTMAYAIPQVRLDHTDPNDLTLTLIAPNGEEFPLFRHAGNGIADNIGTGSNDCSGTPLAFDDRAAEPIDTQNPPFAGIFRPESPLDEVAGIPSGGTWKLRVTDFDDDGVAVGCFKLTVIRRK